MSVNKDITNYTLCYQITTMKRVIKLFNHSNKASRTILFSFLPLLASSHAVDAYLYLYLYYTIRLNIGDFSVIMVNCYFKYADRIGIHLDNLDGILNRFRGEKILIAADANARSVLWFNDSTDDRGEELEALMLAHDLVLFNSPGEVSTYENTRGHTSNIDVTLGSRSMEQRVRNWSVHGDMSISDHRSITYNMMLTQEQICCQRSKIEVKPTSIKAVSYTHLDVYKRQKYM